MWSPGMMGGEWILYLQTELEWTDRRSYHKKTGRLTQNEKMCPKSDSHRGCLGLGFR